MKQNKIIAIIWIISLLIFLIGIRGLNNPDLSLDINVHDTYYVIGLFEFSTFVSSIYFLLGFGYWIIKILKGKLNQLLTSINMIIIVSLPIIYSIIWLVEKFKNSEDFQLYSDYYLTNITILISSILFIFIALPTYILNLILAIYKREKNNASR